MSEPFVVSIHIPKTAGTTLAEVFNRCFARRVIFDYEGYEKPQVISPLMRNNLGFVKEYFDVLHGHFLASKYLTEFQNAKFVATVREPVNRIISQYIHELNDSAANAWYHKDLITGRMDVIEFAATVGNAQARHLDGRAINEYDLLLVSEQLKSSLIVFSHKIKPLKLETHFGLGINLPIENTGANRAKTVKFDNEIRTKISRILDEEKDIYRYAVELLAKSFKNIIT